MFYAGKIGEKFKEFVMMGIDFWGMKKGVKDGDNYLLEWNSMINGEA